MNKLGFNEVLPAEELLPAEMEAVVGGAQRMAGAFGFHCGCGNNTEKDQ